MRGLCLVSFGLEGAGRDLIIPVGTMDPGFSSELPLVVGSALFSLKVGTILMLGM
jgi:hypothetical protein